jgi:protein SCO1/2
MGVVGAAAVLIALIAVLVGRELLTGASKSPVATHANGTAAIGGPFALTDHTGRAVTDADFKGAHMLVYFGFTFCPDVCPTTLQTVGLALDRLGALADRVRPVFVTVDPERDSPAVLGEYVRHFHPRLVGLTGSAAQIAAIAKAYRLYYAEAPASDGGGPDDYTMDHSSILYLIGPDGVFVTHFAHGTSAEALARGLSEHLQ